jgi:hypothetical protein
MYTFYMHQWARDHVVVDVLVADHSPATVVGALHLRRCRNVVRDVVHVLGVQNHGVLDRLELALLAHPRRLGEAATMSFEVGKPNATMAAADCHDRNSLFVQTRWFLLFF